MASLNKVMLLGNLGRDPETRQAGDSVVSNFSIEWVNIVCWRRLAEIARDYLRKGSQIFVEGKLQTRKWQDKSGADRYTTEVVADNIQMLGGRRDDQGAAQGSSAPARSGQPNQRRSAPPSPPPAYQNDDLPF